MKKIKYLLFVILFCLFTNVKAVDDCTTEEMNRLRELANNVQFKMDYIMTETEDGEEVQYSIQVLNITDDLNVSYRENTDGEFKNISVSDFDYLRFLSGSSVEFRINSYTNDLCTDELLKTEKIEFPKYNYYYLENKEKCSKYPEFTYCKEFMDVNYNEFKKIDKLFDEYINSNSSNINDILSSNNNIYIYVAVGLLITGLIATLLIINKKNKEL